MESTSMESGNLFPFRWRVLAFQLDYLSVGVPGSTIFALNGAVPDEYDPLNPPDGIEVGSRQAHLLEKFFKIDLERSCKAKITDPVTGVKKRCGHVCRGFREVVKHHHEKHPEKLKYVCVVEDCLSIFNKIGNGKRHSDCIHGTRPITGNLSEILKDDTLRPIRTLTEKRGLQKIARRESAKRRRLERQKERKEDHCSGAHAKSVKLDISSEIIEMEESPNTVNIAVMQTEHTSFDLEKFHLRYLRRAFFRGEKLSCEKAEWLAASGLLDIYYGKDAVAFKFLKYLKSTKPVHKIAQNDQQLSDGRGTTSIETGSRNESVLLKSIIREEGRQEDSLERET